MASGTIKAVVPKSDIVDNLTTNDATKVLSAKQGKALNDKFGKQLYQVAYADAATVAFTLANNSRYLFISTTSGAEFQSVVLLVAVTTTGVVSVFTIQKGNDAVVSHKNNSLKLTFPQTNNRHYYSIPLNDCDQMTLDNNPSGTYTEDFFLKKVNGETITTDSNGVAITSYSRADYTCISATSGSSIITPFVQTNGDGGKIGVRVTRQNGNPVANETFSINMLLMKASS